MIESLDVLGNAISKHDQNNQITVIDTFNKNNKYEILKITSNNKLLRHICSFRMILTPKYFHMFCSET